MENPSGLEGENGFAGNKNNLSENPENQAEPVSSIPDFGAYGDNYSNSINLQDRPKEFLGVGGLAKISWGMLVERYKKFIVILVISLAFFFTSLILVAIAASLRTDFIFLFVAALVSFVLIIIFSLVENIAIMEVIGNKDITLKEAFKKSFSKTIPYFKAILASSAITFNIFLPFIFLGIAYSLMVIGAIETNNSIQIFSYPLFNFINILIMILLVLFIILLFPVAMFFSAWQNFVSASLIIDGKPVMESLAYSYGLIKHRKRGVIWRYFVFIVIYVIILIPLDILAEKSLIFKVIYQTINFILGFWMFIYSYAMYSNLKMMGSADADPKDIKTARKFIKIGVAGMIMGLIILGVVTFLSGQTLSKQKQDAQVAKEKASIAMQQQLKELKDTDGDGLTDKGEEMLGSSLNKEDTDNDGLSDYDEVKKWRTDPLKADTNNDGYSDGEEVVNGYDPLGPGKMNNSIESADIAENENTGYWIYDICSEIGVYSADIIGLKQWKISDSDCGSPQCRGDFMSADNSIDFSDYPARNACKEIGGRLPTYEELYCIYKNKNSLGNFQNDDYWSSEQSAEINLANAGNDYYALSADFSQGVNGTNYTTNKYNVRCVKDK